MPMLDDSNNVDSIFNSPYSPNSLQYQNQQSEEIGINLNNDSSSGSIINSNHNHVNTSTNWVDVDDSFTQHHISPLKLNIHQHQFNNLSNQSPMKQLNFNDNDVNNSWLSTSNTISSSMSPDILLFGDSNNNNNNNNTINNSNTINNNDNFGSSMDYSFDSQISSFSSSQFQSQEIQQHQQQYQSILPLSQQPQQNKKIKATSSKPKISNMICKNCNLNLKAKYISFEEVIFICTKEGCLFPLTDDDVSSYIFDACLFKKGSNKVKKQ